jgi:hypothetical protein
LGATRGPGRLIACIEDALNIGHSQYANDSGEAFFTLPYNHPMIGMVREHVTHVQIQRQANSQAKWRTVGWHLVDDRDSTPEDSIKRASDYVSLLDKTDTAVDTEYADQEVGSILSTEAANAIAAGGVDAKLGFMTVGHIDQSGQTSTFSSAYQSRLAFMKAVVQTCRIGTQRPVMDVTFDREAVGVPDFAFTFYKNRGVDRPEIPLRWGIEIDGFRELSGGSTMATHLKAIAQSLTGSALLFSEQDGASSHLYGYMEKPVQYAGVPDQESLDRTCLADAKLAAQLDRDLALSIRPGALGPYEGYELGDSFPVTINRGDVHLNQAWYTLWGLEWLALPDGTERLLPAFLPKMT